MAYIAGNTRSETPDARASVNRKYALTPISEPHTIGTDWTRTTDPRDSVHWTHKVQTTLQRGKHTMDYSKGSPKATHKSGIRGPHYPYKPQHIEAVTNATHKRNARHKRAPIIK